MVDNACDLCLLEPICQKMCPEAKLYYDTLVGKNPNYYERVRDDGLIVCGTTTSKQSWVIDKKESKLRKEKINKAAKAVKKIPTESFITKTIKKLRETFK